MNDLTTTAECAAGISRGKPDFGSNGKFDPAVKKSPLQVLVVDDEALIRWSVAETLVDLGVDVEQAVDAASALAALETAEWHFDVIVLDLRLPDMDDLTLLSTIRRRLPQVAVVLMTAFGTPEIVAEARALGVTDILNKPFELGELGRVVLAAGRTAAP
ncbi:MAG: response regulator [Acidobacteriota bacterium]|nr:response regulator [Acidobacteriota bacterium]